MTWRVVFAAIAVGTVAVSCASSQSSRLAREQEELQIRESKFNEAMGSWLNHDVNELIRSWGPPHATFTMPNGNTMIVFRNSRTVTIPPMVFHQSPGTWNVQTRQYGSNVDERGTFNPPQYSTTPPLSIQLSCEQAFEVEKNTQKIISWNARGNKCY